MANHRNTPSIPATPALSAVAPRVRPLRRALAHLGIVAVSVGAMLGLLASPAAAGINGQQVEFGPGRLCLPAGDQLGNVSISGHNQDGHWVTWSGQGVGQGVDGTAFASDWWWKGAITVTFATNANPTQQQTVHAYVPEGNDAEYQYRPDTVRVDCLGTLRSGEALHIKTGDGFNLGCVSLDSNPAGHYTQYTNYYGYYEVDQDGHISPSGYGIAGGKMTPAIVSRSYSDFECD